MNPGVITAYAPKELILFINPDYYKAVAPLEHKDLKTINSQMHLISLLAMFARLAV
jgi:hypothetical protein